MSMFDFGIQDDATDNPEIVAPTAAAAPKTVQLEPFAQLDLSQLLDSLPPLISFSPLPIHLFDARFQLISEGHGDESSGRDLRPPTAALGFLDAPSDLVPGVYEGGLKTWECSLDLVGYLDSLDLHFSGKRILEIGCGTGIPSVFILHRLFGGDSTSTSETHVHLQDYNASVLELITLPNILLAWYMSPASQEYRSSESEPDTEYPPTEPTASGELPLTPTLKAAFVASLSKYGIKLTFSSGAWGSLHAHLESTSEPTYDVVVTSETIYRTESLHALIELLHRVSGPNTMCLVAAKVLYFGVGGGVSEFSAALQSKAIIEARCAGKAESVWDRKIGVGRKILRIEWEA
ncbi:hypothetical protein FB45DRAFT_1098493 [Roridomyces roridus]|uniref:protein-histidine N-methyltransferase n=1 Tax=Roridomyces roridus TaxID=1738132 RepID=A0AAD7CDR7_9AGAR|nr:hypothetical protein FB45DRAFT_1098493 [Roridomyces roridus]